MIIKEEQISQKPTMFTLNLNANKVENVVIFKILVKKNLKNWTKEHLHLGGTHLLSKYRKIWLVAGIKRNRVFTHLTRAFPIKEKNTNNHENEKWQKIITNEQSKLSKADWKSSKIKEQRKMTGCILSFFLVAEKWICCYRIITCQEWCVSARWLVIYRSGMTEDANSWNQKLSFWKSNIKEKYCSKRKKENTT